MSYPKLIISVPRNQIFSKAYSQLQQRELTLKLILSAPSNQIFSIAYTQFHKLHSLLS